MSDAHTASMSDDDKRHHVNGMAKALADTLSGMSAKQREQEPFPRFAEDFNRLLELAKEAAPEHDARIWPQPIRVEDAGAGRTQVFARYVEIEAAARQIASLVPRPIVM